MAADVIDELIVKLKLDADEYKQADRDINIWIAITQHRLEEADNKDKKRDTERKKRMKSGTSLAKTFASALRNLALSFAGFLGIAGGTSLAALVSFEQSMRRAGVSTGQSNRELQAWGSAARRLGADADAGRQALADLAREQQQFNITGNAPTLAAFARMGIRATPDTPLVDILAQAQQTYRQAAPAQRQQIESGLAAQGVSGDLILMIKSEKDVREEFARSFAESATENRKALDALSDTFESAKNGVLNFANALAGTVQPYVEQLADWLNKAGSGLSEFADDIVAAGGGLDGLSTALRKESGPLARALRTVTEGLEILDYAARLIAQAWQRFASWKPPGAQRTVGEAVDVVKEAVSSFWNDLLTKSRRASRGLAENETDVTDQMPLPARANKRDAFTNASSVMSDLITQYGLSVPQAAAVAANVSGESGFKLSAYNPAGGGTGARGLFQLRGARSAAFKARYGIMPDEATQQQQLEFLMTDPYERALLNKALAAKGGAQQLGTSFSDIFEGHGIAAENVRRGTLANTLAQQYTGPDVPGGGTGGTSIHIENVTVKADNPQQFVGGIQRVTNLQNYQSGNR